MHKLGKYLRASSPAPCCRGDAGASRSASEQQNTFRGHSDKMDNVILKFFRQLNQINFCFPLLIYGNNRCQVVWKYAATGQ